ncbi:DNA cytosine methyltransferase [Ruoffia tabacinasalis]|nr:DNA cytosine methyltransferase [Ruoffia tabacinasalis]
MTYKVLSLFAGVGGIDLGFEQTGQFETILANEFDSNAAKTYALNFNNQILVEDIHNIDATELPDFDVLLSGFPCQAFSVAGYRKGFEDERGDLFFETLRIIKEKRPRVVFLENVKNLVTHDNGNTFKVIKEALTYHGYYIKYKVMNAKDYGDIPQNRERIYIVGFDNKEDYLNFSFPEAIERQTTLSDIIDFERKIDDYFYYTPEKHSYYPALAEGITSQETVYQWRRKYVRENKSGVVPTLTANMGTGGNNVPLVLGDHGIRKLTPRECFNAQGYPDTYQLPEDMALSHLYKQAGNSVVVPVIERIADQIAIALDGVQSGVVQLELFV